MCCEAAVGAPSFGVPAAVACRGVGALPSLPPFRDGTEPLIVRLVFDVRKKVAAGSAVEAYLADSPQGTVLVQVSRPELRAAAPEVFEAFLARAKQLTARQHPALLTPSEASLGRDGRFTLVSRPLSGVTASDRLRARGPLPSTEVQRFVLRVVDALEFLHQHDLVHGCLSPNHLYLEGDEASPDVKLLDTALLLFRGPASLPSVIGDVLVPPEYLSPERVQGQRASPASDLYGLGVLAFELLTGSPPFKAATPAGTRAAHISGVTPPLPPSLSGWRPFFDGTLSADPARRFSSLAALRAALLTAQESTPPIPFAFSLPPPKAVVGEQLGPYVLEAKLGEGGMGSVFRAAHKTLGRTVAVKVLRPELAQNPEMVQRFVIEAQAVNRVRHPHIVEVFDLVTEPGAPMYFVMELLEGQSIRAAGKARPLELSRVIRLMRQAAEALSAAHAVGVMHRDVKPDNLFLVPDDVHGERLKVLDFGVARMDPLHGSSPIPKVTQTGQTVGTPLWMAPEQLVAGDLDPRVDVYALATVTYVLLTRRFPFDGVAMNEVVLQRMSKPAKPLPPMSFLGEPVPPEVIALLARCLERDAKLRPMMPEMAQGLLAIERSLALVPDVAAQPPAASAARHWWWWAVLFASGLAGTAKVFGLW